MRAELYQLNIVNIAPICWEIMKIKKKQTKTKKTGTAWELNSIKPIF